MLDIKFVRENPEIVKQNQERNISSKFSPSFPCKKTSSRFRSFFCLHNITIINIRRINIRALR